MTSGDNQPSQIRLEKLRLAMVWNSYNLFAEELLKENKANPWTVGFSSFRMLDLKSTTYDVGESIR